MDPNTKVPFWGYHLYGKLLKIVSVQRRQIGDKSTRIYYASMEIDCDKYAEGDPVEIYAKSGSGNRAFGEHIIEEFLEPKDMLKKAKQACIINIFRSESLSNET